MRFRRPAVRELALWLAAAAALSPVLLELAQSLGASDGSPRILLAPALFALLAWRLRWPREEPRPSGVAWIALGLALEILGLLSDTGSLARLGLPPVVIGVAVLAGRPPPTAAALSLWMVPPPTALLVEGSPWLESWLAALASLPFRALGFAVEAAGPVLRTPSARFEFTAFHTGIPLAILLAELGWYAGLRAGATLPGLVRRAIACAALAPGLQLLGAGLVVALLVAGHPKAARLWLDAGLALAVGAVGLAWVESRAPGRPAAQLAVGAPTGSPRALDGISGRPPS
jgi:hypothetical protein